MSDPSRPGRRRADSFDGLRDLQRRTSGRGRPDRDRDPGRDRPDPVGRRGRSAGGAGGSRRVRLRMIRRWPRRVLVGANVIVALLLVAAVGTYGYVHQQLSHITHIRLASLTPAQSKAFTMLIVGSDTRDLKGSGNAQFGSASTTPGQRSDTIMLARVVPSTRSITLLSIPRDLYVDIPGIGYSRINAAFDSGPNLLVATIEKRLGIPINHFVEVNFDTFRQITDAVGGVKVWFPTPARDLMSLLSVPRAGCVNLTGQQALGYVRSRHYQYEVNGVWQTQGLSDLARIQRQQNYVKKLLKKAEGKLTDPFTLNKIVGGITKNLTVDSGLSTNEMIALAVDLRTADVAGIPTETVPVYNETIGGAEVLGLQQPEAGQMIAAFNSLGTTSAAASATTTATPATTAATPAADAGSASSSATTAAPTTTTTYLLPGPTPTAAELASCQ